MQTKNAVLNIRINPDLKKNCEELYASFGITITDAVNMFLSKSLIENGLPFELKKSKYNLDTINALKEGVALRQDIKNGKIKPYSNATDMLKDLKS